MMTKRIVPGRTTGAHKIEILRLTAIVGMVFALIICVLVIVNYLQLKRVDPLNTRTMKVLVDRMHLNPADQQLRQEIRELDLISRKAFFTNQWQIRMGGYLLFFNIVVVVICLKSLEHLRKIKPEMPSDTNPDYRINRAVNRNWVIYTGGSVIILSFLLVFLTHHELGKALDETLQASRNQEPRQPGISGTGDSVNNSEKGKAGMAGTKEDSAGWADTLAGSTVINMDGFPTEEEVVQNYPSFRGPGGNGIAFQKNIPTHWDGKSGKNIRWKTEVPLSGYNSPIIWNDRIFLTGANETRREVYCFDLRSGSLLWRKPVEKVQGSPSGEPKIIQETGYSAPTMTTDGRRVYAIFANGDLISLDFDGNHVWSKNLGMPINHYGHSSSLIMYRDLLIIQYDQRGSGSVMALAGKTGKTVWQTSRSVKVSWASPVIVNTGNRTELILAAEPMIISYNPASGSELWRMDCISGEVGPSVACSGGVVYSVNDYSKLSAIKIGDPPELLWEDSDYLSDIPSPVAAGNNLFLVTSYGAMVCYDGKTGKKNWEKEFGTAIFASPVVAEGKIFVLEKRGIMHVLRADKDYEVISDSPLGEGSSCTPAFADGKIIIRGDKNLYCIGK